MPDSLPVLANEAATPDPTPAFAANEKRFRLLVDGVTNFALFLIDPDGRIASWNEGARRILGYEEAEAVGLPFVQIFTPEDRANGVPEREMATAARSGQAADVRWHLRKDGTRFWADGVLERLTAEDGGFEGYAKVLRDATAAKQADDSLRASETQLREQGEFLRRVLDSSNDCIKTLDLNGHLVSMTEAGKRIMEVDDFSTICGVDWLTFWQDDTREAVRVAIETAKAGGTGRFQGYCPTMKGNPRWWDVIVVPILGADGKPEQLMGISRDVTDQKTVEDREHARLTDIFMRTPAFMAALRGPEHRFDIANPQYYQIVGHRDILGKTVAEALPEVVEQGFIGLLDRVYQTGEPFVGTDIRIMLQKSPSSALEECFIDFTYQPLFDDEGAISGILVHGIDLTQRKQQERQLQSTLDALSVSEARYRVLVDSIDEGFCIIQMLFDEQGNAYDYLFLETNTAFEQNTGLIKPGGKTIRELAPGIAESWFRIYGDVVRTGQSIRFENHDPALGRWFDAYAQRVGPAEESKVGIFFTDITARKEVEETLRRSEERLQSAQARLAAALSAGNIATWTLDLMTYRLSPDANFAPLFGVAPEHAAGGEFDVYLSVILPEDQQLVVDAIARAVAENVPYEAEYRVVLQDGSIRWLAARGTVERDSEGKPVSMPGVIVDISERIERERKEQFLNDVTVRARALLDPEEILYETARAVGEFTGAHRAVYAEIDDEADTATISRDYVQAGQDLRSRAGAYSLSTLGLPIIASLRAGNITQIADTETDPRLTPEDRADFRARQVQSFLAVPLQDGGRFVAVLAVHSVRPRAWTSDEAGILTAAMDRTWLAVENARLFRETQRRAEHEALLNQIGAAARGTLEPDTILRSTVEILGNGLRADRCYFVRYDRMRDRARVFPEWLREEAGVEPLAGRTLQMSQYLVTTDPLYRAGGTYVVDDVVASTGEVATPLQSLNVRALLRVPISVGDQMTALCVVMSHGPRHWTEEEVRLVENVAAQVRAALESAHIQQRERNIAVQLQEALQPPSPENLPGLDLAAYYRPALAEASVGGDFYDVFPIEEGCTALVVADLSGKGLAAASQVSTVRNMLRYAVYSASTLSEAVTGLHRALVKHDLLSGFATLFIGLYDDKAHSLTYVNCGQEPGLLLRAATGAVERMPPTGPVLGGFGSGDFEEEQIHLEVGDVLALFTDGLTEVGPSRKVQLDIDGVSNVLQTCCGEHPAEGNSPQSVVDCLISGVDEFARGGARDDIALLVGVVR